MILEMLNQLTDELGYAYKRASDAEAALEEKDAEINALKKRVQELENASGSCEVCGWAKRALEGQG